jgi:hypothetical protein
VLKTRSQVFCCWLSVFIDTTARRIGKADSARYCCIGGDSMRRGRTGVLRRLFGLHCAREDSDTENDQRYEGEGAMKATGEDKESEKTAALWV